MADPKRTEGGTAGSGHTDDSRADANADRGPAVPPSDAPDAPAQPLHVLVAEDDPLSRKLALHLLEQRGHRVQVVSTGTEVLELLENDPTFDLILLDVQMPEMDGLVTTRIIREKERGTGCHIPIVALTAHAIEIDRQRCLEAGMDRFVTKPIHPDQLMEVLETVAAAGVIEGSNVDAAEAPGREDLLERLEGDTELLVAVSRIFLRNWPPLLEGLRAALTQGDSELLARLAHGARSSVGTLTVGPAFQGLTRLEEMARGGDLQRAEGELAAVERAVDQLIVALEEIVGE